MAFRVDCWMGEKSKQTESIVERNNDHIAGQYHRRRVIEKRTAGDQCSAVDPDHHGQGLLLVLIFLDIRRKDVERQTVFATAPRLNAGVTVLIPEKLLPGICRTAPAASSADCQPEEPHRGYRGSPRPRRC